MGDESPKTAVKVLRRPFTTEANTSIMEKLAAYPATNENKFGPPIQNGTPKTVLKVPRGHFATKANASIMEKLLEHATVTENETDLRARISLNWPLLALLDRLRTRDGPCAPISKIALDLLVFLHNHRKFFGQRRRLFTMLTGYSSDWWESSAEVRKYNRKIPTDW